MYTIEQRDEQFMTLRDTYKDHEKYNYVEKIMVAMMWNKTGNTPKKVLKSLKEFFPENIKFIRQIEGTLKKLGIIE